LSEVEQGNDLTLAKQRSFGKWACLRCAVGSESREGREAIDDEREEKGEHQDAADKSKACVGVRALRIARSELNGWPHTTVDTSERRALA
jgi:hypothetical protein